jgi:hypothetical protein
MQHPDGMLYFKAKMLNGNKRGEVNNMEDSQMNKQEGLILR